MTDADSERRTIECRVLTTAGFVHGHFHVPRQVPFVDHLQATEHFYTLTDVRLPGQSRTVPFLALQRSATLLVVPAVDEWPNRTDSQKITRVSCLFQGGVLFGKLSLAPGVRVSDHLAEDRFIVVWGATLGLDRTDEDPSLEAASIVLVHTSRLVGVAEM